MARSLPLPRRMIAAWRRLGMGRRRRAAESEPGLPATLALHDLPLAVLDTETTGLNPLKDRIVSIGGLHWRQDAAEALQLDLRVHPGRPIPASATRIHGIGDAAVAAAPPFALIGGMVIRFWQHRVLLGHNIGFDLALLRAEAERARLPFRRPPAALDIGLLYAALFPREQSYTLEGIAARLDVHIQHRHEALGDCETAAALWCALRPHLAAQGIGTLGAARELMCRPRDLVFNQRQAGWALDLLLPD